MKNDVPIIVDDEFFFEKEVGISEWQSYYKIITDKQLRSEYVVYSSLEDSDGIRGMAIAEEVDYRRGSRTIDRFFREIDLTPSDLKILDLYNIMTARGYDFKTTDSLKLRKAVEDSGFSDLYAGSVKNDRAGKEITKGYTLPISEIDYISLRGFVKAKMSHAIELKRKLNSGKKLK